MVWVSTRHVRAWARPGVCRSLSNLARPKRILDHFLYACVSLNRKVSSAKHFFVRAVVCKGFDQLIGNVNVQRHVDGCVVRSFVFAVLFCEPIIAPSSLQSAPIVRTKEIHDVASVAYWRKSSANQAFLNYWYANQYLNSCFLFWQCFP
jgi:hypothetical protein